ncbi:hypothetical protein ASD11_06005 [Aeromicrobium sp. Root495]|uniref:signal peptidase I n=1 Tax=Aeromicrobium sp. Root495 TaxID=1736550 RepID=UPI0006F76487|nr:signal peptidase I [Aeromicrobium sp. Root495]KQY59143.1 hypothetical protein ASD11_06005 [Aeromicrobium sp. Root495]
MRSTTLRDRALTVGAVLGSLCLVAAIACAVLDVRPLVFRSGSMSPSIGTGALAFAKNVPAADLSKGEVVSVSTSSGDRVTHRIVSIGQSGSGERPLQLKGDANKNPDAELYRVASADRVLFDIPLAGYAVSFLRSGAGLFLLGLLAAGLALVVLRPGGPDDHGGRRSSGGQRRRPGGRRKAARLAVPALAGVVTLAVAAPAMATFVDTGRVTSGTVATRSVTAAASMTCANNNNALGIPVTATLTVPNAASNQNNTYVIEYASSASGNATSTMTVAVGSGATTSFTVESGFLGGFSGSSVWVRVYTAASPNAPYAWKTTEFRSWRLNVSLLLGRVSCNSSVA